MNKYQEALDRLNTINMVNFIGDKELIKHKDNDIKTLQELVDKESPMKAKDIKITTFHKDKDYYVGNKEFECPKCGVYQDANFNNYFNPQYCSYCGQKLDIGGNE